MKFRAQIDCDNAAFADQPREEVARILRDLASRLEEGFDAEFQPLRDVNGNLVGSAEWLP